MRAVTLPAAGVGGGGPSGRAGPGGGATGQAPKLTLAVPEATQVRYPVLTYLQCQSVNHL